MQIHKCTVALPSAATLVKLTPLGDVHLGSSSCDEDEFKRWVKVVADDPHHYTVLMGDMCDCIVPSDKRFDADEVADWLWQPRNRARIVDAQYERMHDILKAIPSERILGILRGNHENTIKWKHYRDLTLDLSRQLNIPYLDEQAFIRMTFTRPKTTASHPIDIYAVHGSSTGRKAGAKVNVIQDIGGFVDADILLHGHTHDRIVSTDVRLGLNSQGRLVKRERLYIITGTFLKTYEVGSASYGARANYRPTTIGPITVNIKPFSGQGGSEFKMWCEV